MLVFDEYLGHADDVVTADARRIVVDDDERRRSRVRTETTAGEDVGIVVGRVLRDGDVVAADDSRAVVDLRPVEAVGFDAAALAPPRALEVGHAVGNRHWDLATRGDETLVRGADGPERTAAALEPMLPPTVETRVVSVPPSTFDDGDSRSAGHGHAHPDGHGSAPTDEGGES